MASRIWRAPRTSTRRTRGGDASSTGPATSTTSAPRAAARAAMAKPILPVERLPRKRTGSRSSTVGPAVTRTRLPTRSFGATAANTAATISSGSSIRPGPSSPLATRPLAGPRISTRPSLPSVSTLRFVAGCSHMRGCMAGATSTGPRATRASAATRSSARPCARRARKSAVAGTTRTTSASSAMATCISPANDGSHIPVRTGSPVMPESVAGPRKCPADAVITGRTRAPAFTRSRATCAAL